MATHATHAEKRSDVRTDVRPQFFNLGIDGRGAHHVWDRETATVHIVHSDGSRGRRMLGDKTIDDYVDAVDDTHGWSNQRLVRSFGDVAEHQVEVR